jgi:hypothetical protein
VLKENMTYMKGHGSYHNPQGSQSKDNLSPLYFEVLYQHLLRGADKIINTSVRIISFWAEIQNVRSIEYKADMITTKFIGRYIRGRKAYIT